MVPTVFAKGKYFETYIDQESDKGAGWYTAYMKDYSQVA